ncbi:MAG TPA: DUF3604 domain-containing protein [Myxococcota bacterium]|nr:DUF3604 domain-containing protein [Myxococcota bacterium]
MSRLRRVVLIVLGVAFLPAAYVLGARLHWYGVHQGPGEITDKRVPAAVVEQRAQAQQRAAAAITTTPAKEILFGDLHVHTTFSTDAFLWSLPMVNGEGAQPIADACDYARFCSGLDFWSINDHAEATTPRRWKETKEAIRQCNAAAGDPQNPDVVAFLGWEWSQVGRTPQEHYGHKNVILRDLEESKVPTRVIGAAGLATEGLRGQLGGMPWYVPLLDFSNRQPYYDFIKFMDEVRAVPACAQGVSARELPDDCYESAATPKELFRKLDEWGDEAIVIPHGNTWGFYTPPGSTWDKQLANGNHDPRRQFLIEIMSGHGNSEQYRDWKEVVFDASGKAVCPEPRPDYLPSCWQAGEIIGRRCHQAGLDDAECTRRAAQARQNYVDGGVAGHWTVPGVRVEEWLDSGQCRDCFIPSFNYRPGVSTQYALALTNFDDPANPQRFRFGILASSDNHHARPGTGYKEFGRHGNTEAGGPRDETWRRRLNPWIYQEEAAAESRAPGDAMNLSKGFATLEAERQASFFMTGGLAAVHSEGRSREAIWEALERKEVYGTSGDHVLLWFNLLNAEGPDGSIVTVPMGGATKLNKTPRFEVRAIGAFKQKPGCPDSSTDALSAERIEKVCKGECYNPSDERKLITRIEVVRIRPQRVKDEPLRQLIEDPWKTIPCEPSQNGCVAQFEDPDFESAARDAIYYVRAIEEPSPAVNAGGLRCKLDEAGRCIEVNPCWGDYRLSASDDCLATIEERAWSSPIFIDLGSPQPLGG